MTYDAAKRMTMKELGNGTWSSLTYDAADKILRTADFTSGNVPVTSFDDTWNAASRRIQRINLDGDITTWTYDKSAQLTGERRTDILGTSTTTYIYDPVGNRLVLEDDTKVVTSTYDAANHLQTADDNTAGVTTYTYDQNGNQHLIEAPSTDITTQTWSYENQLIGVETPVEQVSYTYAPVTRTSDELRFSKETGAGLVFYIWDRQNLIIEIDETGLTLADYTVAPQAYGAYISQHRDDSQSSFYHFDPLGSTAALTDGTEMVTDSYLYTAFGEVLPGTGTTANPYQFVGLFGYFRDETTGIYSIHQRDYGADVGRFKSDDPIGFNAGDTNLQRPVGNNPINSIDPGGLEEIQPIAGILAQGTTQNVVQSPNDEYLIHTSSAIAGNPMHMYQHEPRVILVSTLTEQERKLIDRLIAEDPAAWERFQATFKPGGANYELILKQQAEWKRMSEILYGPQQPQIQSRYYSPRGPISDAERAAIDRRIYFEKQIQQLESEHRNDKGELRLSTKAYRQKYLLERQSNGEELQAIYQEEALGAVLDLMYLWGGMKASSTAGNKRMARIGPACQPRANPRQIVSPTRSPFAAPSSTPVPKPPAIPTTATGELASLGPHQGKSGAEVATQLTANGFTAVTGKNGGTIWTKAMPDGNTAVVRVDPAMVRAKPKGFADEVPHIHKEIVPTNKVTNGNYAPADATKLDDVCIPSTDPSKTHIPGGH